MKDFFLVGLGGMVGSIFRYSISKFFLMFLIKFHFFESSLITLSNKSQNLSTEEISTLSSGE